MAVSATSATGSSQTNSASSLSRLSSNLDNFLTILTTQLQHQDPLSPMDTHEFTNQLVLFSSVEQQVKQNSNLEELITLQKNNVALGAVSYVGKEVDASGSDFMLQGDTATLNYYLPSTAKSANLKIFNSNGNLVRQETVDTTTGLHEYKWDGRDSSGNTAPAGQYRFDVTATDSADEPLTVTHGFRGTVTGLEFDNGYAILSIGSVLVPLGNVTGVKGDGSSTNQTADES
ncbi:MAG: flagellar hook assembly protein FlgD [Alphaproteobacteria bacterium]